MILLNLLHPNRLLQRLGSWRVGRSEGRLALLTAPDRVRAAMEVVLTVSKIDRAKSRGKRRRAVAT